MNTVLLMPACRLGRTLSIAAITSALALFGAASAAAVTFSYTGTEQTFTVPVGVTSVYVTAIGGEGATATCPPVASGSCGAGAFGAQVSSSLPVIAGETLYVEVAGNGAGSSGGWGGGAQGQVGGGGGGGASDIRTAPRGLGGSLNSRLLVAAGGGGGGTAGYFNGSAYTGGAGGAPGSAGTNGASISANPIGGAGGGGAAMTTGGAGGAGGTSGGQAGDSGVAGSFGSGGIGAALPGSPIFSGGGGGGGGYYGGGGGGAGGCCSAAGGGGGGGSSFAIPGATLAQTADTTGVPSITILYGSATSDASPSTVGFSGTQPLMTLSAPKPVTITNNGSLPLVISSLTFTGADAGDFVLTANGCMTPVAVGGSCAVTVGFAPQATGGRSASLSIASNAPGSPAAVPLSGTGGALPAGPTGAAGAAGAAGATGAQGPAGKDGQIELVTCKTVTVNQKGRKRKVHEQQCTARLVSGVVTFTVSSTAVHATLSRNGVTYATGESVPSGGGRSALMLTPLRVLPPGRYTLTQRTRAGGRWVRRSSPITIRG